MKLASAMIAAVAATTSAAALAQAVQPGNWEMVSTIVSADMPGMPPGVVAGMKGRPTRFTYCITPDKAKLGPQSLMNSNRNCRFTRFSVRGYHIDSQMICNQMGGTMTATGSGSFTPTSFVSDGRAEMTGRRKMTIVSHAAGRRIGPCGK